MEGNIIIAPPSVFLIWFPPSLPLALPDSLCPSFREQFPFMSAVGGPVEGDHLVDLYRQFLGQNPREGALEWNGLWEVLAFSLPREPSSRSPGPLDLGLKQHFSSSHSTCAGIGPGALTSARCLLSSWRRGWEGPT